MKYKQKTWKYGNIKYEVLDQNIIEVNENGEINAKQVGTSKVKITDETHGYSTYIIVKVIEGITKIQIKEGENSTIALKENGTVWQYGKTTEGNELEPVQVEGLENIVDIGADKTSKIAVNKDGEVYIWGTYTYQDQANKKVTENRKTPVKENIQNIKKVEVYENNYYAVDKQGKLYIWGEGYKNPVLITTKSKVAEIDGKMLLGEDGLVYVAEDAQNKIPYINNVYNISCGKDHKLFIRTDGLGYGMGANEVGQLGNKMNIEFNTPSIVKTEEGFLENVITISAGTKTSIASTLERRSLCLGRQFIPKTRNNWNKYANSNKNNTNARHKWKQSRKQTNRNSRNIKRSYKHSRQTRLCLFRR